MKHFCLHFVRIIPVLILASSSCLAQWKGAPIVDPILPADALMTSQDAFNNFAWQEFIALNWVADPKSPGNPDPSVEPSQFGTPDDKRFVVWESYKESTEVFRKDALPPEPWGAQRALPADFDVHSELELTSTSPHGIKGLMGTSKFGTRGVTLDLSEFEQAGSNTWLTAQNKLITLYERRMNEDEFNYINVNKLYDADVQQTFAVTNGIILPDGSAKFSTYGKVGAIEVKAAWIELPDPSLWKNYKTSEAWVSYPTDMGTGKPTNPRRVTVGLVGLHIIHKTQKAQQFVWATFEHVDNCPSTQDIANRNLKDSYMYYNPEWDSAKECPINVPPVVGKSNLEDPVQVVRMQPISTTTTNDIAAFNRNTWDSIRAANPKSVFLNYQLVNVLWPNSSAPITKGAKTPLPAGDPQPPRANQVVANSTLETYFQTKLNCMDCHQGAPIASVNTGSLMLKVSRSGTSTEGTPLASDYSFLFSTAHSPAKK